MSATETRNAIPAFELDERFEMRLRALFPKPPELRAEGVFLLREKDGGNVTSAGGTGLTHIDQLPKRVRITIRRLQRASKKVHRVEVTIRCERIQVEPRFVGDCTDELYGKVRRAVIGNEL